MGTDREQRQSSRQGSCLTSDLLACRNLMRNFDLREETDQSTPFLS